MPEIVKFSKGVGRLETSLCTEAPTKPPAQALERSVMCTEQEPRQPEAVR